MWPMYGGNTNRHDISIAYCIIVFELTHTLYGMPASIAKTETIYNVQCPYIFKIYGFLIFSD